MSAPDTPTLPPELQRRLADAGVSDDASLQAALERDPDLALAWQRYLLDIALAALLQAANTEELVALWQQLPTDLEQPLLAHVRDATAAAAQSGQIGLAAALRQRLDGLEQLLDAQRDPRAAALGAAIERFLGLLQATDQERAPLADLRALAEAGEATLAPEHQAVVGVDWEALRGYLAQGYTSLGAAHEREGQLEQALAATERAAELQPREAMWQRNRAGTLIAMGRLGEAAAAIAQARALEPGAPRLAELEADLAARG